MKLIAVFVIFIIAFAANFIGTDSMLPPGWPEKMTMESRKDTAK